MLALAGAHRVGKSTLADKFSKESGIHFVKTSTSKIMLDAGFDPALDYALKDRMKIQWAVLEGLHKAYGDAPVKFITDRSPLDAAAYLLADVQRQNTSRELEQEILRYLEACFEVANRHFAMIVVVQPGIVLVDEPGKAPANPAYVEHIHQLITGLVNDERLKVRNFWMPRNHLDLDMRVKALKFAVNRTVERSGVELETHRLNGGLLS
jgi:adenosyl cobinamide kinase/adenosyl cobinamide phosphate guanylyltransferase